MRLNLGFSLNYHFEQIELCYKPEGSDSYKKLMKTFRLIERLIVIHTNSRPVPARMLLEDVVKRIVEGAKEKNDILKLEKDEFDRFLEETSAILDRTITPSQNYYNFMILQRNFITNFLVKEIFNLSYKNCFDLENIDIDDELDMVNRFKEDELLVFEDVIKKEESTLTKEFVNTRFFDFTKRNSDMPIAHRIFAGCIAYDIQASYIQKIREEDDTYCSNDYCSGEYYEDTYEINYKESCKFSKELINFNKANLIHLTSSDENSDSAEKSIRKIVRLLKNDHVSLRYNKSTKILIIKDGEYTSQFKANGPNIEPIEIHSDSFIGKGYADSFVLNVRDMLMGK